MCAGGHSGDRLTNPGVAEVVYDGSYVVVSPTKAGRRRGGSSGRTPQEVPIPGSFGPAASAPEGSASVTSVSAVSEV